MKNVRKEIMVPVKKVLIKIGSAVLAGDDGLDIAIIQQLADEIAGLKDEGYQIIIVTSGAIASGKHRMGIAGPLKSIPQKQAAAAIGQGRLMRVYANAFDPASREAARALTSRLRRRVKRRARNSVPVATTRIWNKCGAPETSRMVGAPAKA